jgi:hypothetical protein
LARWFEENKPHPSVKVDGLKATITVSDPKAFLRFFASLDDAELLSPAPYRDWFRERLGNLQTPYLTSG